MNADYEFLGKGWQFPVKPDADGGIARALYEESIRHPIWIILATSRGERVMRPDFGCGIHDLVFAVNNTTTAGLIAREVRQALILWEPRIEVMNVSVAPGAGEPNLLLITIDFRVRTTNSQFNLVYLFYLERSAA